MKIPDPRRLSNGRYYIYLRLGGKAYSVTEDTKAGCIARARSIKAQYKAGELATAAGSEREGKDTAPTLGAVLDAYIAKYEPVLSPSTVRGYKAVRKTRFADYMDLPVDKIDAQEMVNDELGAVSVKTVKNAWGVVKSALKNSKVTVPAVKFPQAPVKEIPFLQPEEIKPFMDAIRGDRAEIAALLMLHGLRISEAMALTWETGIDLEAEKIRIDGAIVQGTGNKFVAKNTNKNTTSRRTIDMMIPRLKEALQEVPDKTGYIVTMRPHVVLRHIKAACTAAGVTVVGNHGLRHSAASLAYDLGWSPRMIMDFFGWSNMQTAHKVYIRLSNSRKTKNVNQMAEFYKSGN